MEFLKILLLCVLAAVIYGEGRLGDESLDRRALLGEIVQHGACDPLPPPVALSEALRHPHFRDEPFQDREKLSQCGSVCQGGQENAGPQGDRIHWDFDPWNLVEAVTQF